MPFFALTFCLFNVQLCHDQVQEDAEEMEELVIAELCIVKVLCVYFFYVNGGEIMKINF